MNLAPYFMGLVLFCQFWTQSSATSDTNMKRGVVYDILRWFLNTTTSNILRRLYSCRDFQPTNCQNITSSLVVMVISVCRKCADQIMPYSGGSIIRIRSRSVDAGVASALGVAKNHLGVLGCKGYLLIYK